MKAIRLGRRPKWKIALHLWTISALSLFPSRRAESKSNPVTIIFRHSEVSQTATISPPLSRTQFAQRSRNVEFQQIRLGSLRRQETHLLSLLGEGSGPERIPLAFFSSPSLLSLPPHLRMACNEYLRVGFVLARCCCLRKIKQHEWILGAPGEVTLQTDVESKAAARGRIGNRSRGIFWTNRQKKRAGRFAAACRRPAIN